MRPARPPTADETMEEEVSSSGMEGMMREDTSTEPAPRQTTETKMTRPIIEEPPTSGDGWSTQTVLFALAVAMLIQWFFQRQQNEKKRNANLKTERLGSRILQQPTKTKAVDSARIAETETKEDAAENEVSDTPSLADNEEGPESDPDPTAGAVSPPPEIAPEESNEEKVEPSEDEDVKKEEEKKEESKPKKKSNRILSSAVVTPRTAPSFQRTDSQHPGLDAFWYWMDTETSLFRIYTRCRNDGVEVVAPYNPKSRRGLVQVSLEVTNAIDSKDTIKVYWVDYKGAEILKGTMHPGQTWTQTTWMEHPWIFRRTPYTSRNNTNQRDLFDAYAQQDAEEESNEIVMHYIPYRIVPTTEVVPTVNPEDPNVGLHVFSIRSPPRPSWGGPGPFYCDIGDQIMPFPAQDHVKTMKHALAWTLHHCHRMDWLGWNVLQKYLTKIVQHPEEPKYRQIRVSNKTFAESIWQTPARGLLFAIGFVEHEGYAELGCASEPLPSDRVQEVSQLLYVVGEWQRRREEADASGVTLAQPEGADGYGLAGYGRAGGMNDPRA